MFSILLLIKKYKKYISIIILLILIITVLCIILLKKQITNKKNTSPYSLSNNYNTYTHQGHAISTNVYNNTKTTTNTTFKITAQHVQYLSDQKTIQFIQPKIIIFDLKNHAIWKIISNQAILNYKDKTLNLYGYIYINNISNNIYYLSMLTNHIKINLINNDIFANTIVILHGHYFYSIGTKMHGNLCTQIIQLINNTKTYYEIQYTQHTTTNNIHSDY